MGRGGRWLGTVALVAVAVVGGTDIYDNVRGSMTGTQLGRGPRREYLVFRLIA